MSINLQTAAHRSAIRHARAGRALAALRVLAVVVVLTVTPSTHGGSVAAATALGAGGPAPKVAAGAGGGTVVGGTGVGGTVVGGTGVGGAGQAAPGADQGVVAPPRVQARAVILADESTGQVLFERNASAARAMASTTKVMTAL